MVETPSRFRIENVSEDPTVAGLFNATVIFAFDGIVAGVDVSQVVRVNVRIKAASSDSLEALHAALFGQAVVTLSHALAASQSKSPQELLSASRKRAAKELAAAEDLSGRLDGSS